MSEAQVMAFRDDKHTEEVVILFGERITRPYKTDQLTKEIAIASLAAQGTSIELVMADPSMSALQLNAEWFYTLWTRGVFTLAEILNGYLDETTYSYPVYVIPIVNSMSPLLEPFQLWIVPRVSGVQPISTVPAVWNRDE
ncbi:MAG: hypothetical protein ACOCXQ_05130 [Patescibacteria group bacterium]